MRNHLDAQSERPLHDNSNDGSTTTNFKRPMEQDENASQISVNNNAAKRQKLDTQSADVDIIESPVRSRNIVQSVLSKLASSGNNEGDDGDSSESDNGGEEHDASRLKHNGKSDITEKGKAKFDSASSSDEESDDEDDVGELATEALDVEITATLRAIRERDPRIFDKSAKFYSEETENPRTDRAGKPKKKAMYLQDYHRKNLLEGANDDSKTVDQTPTSKSYAQEQAELKHDFLRSIHDVAEDGEENDDSEEDGFLKPTKATSPPPDRPPIPDVEAADKDPENFLSNYFASRAWVPAAESRFAHLESDDEEEDQRAEDFEYLFNTRFEDPNETNRAIMTYSRTVADEKSVRREEKTPRQRARERKKLRKKQEKTELEEDRKRLKKVKVNELEEKVKKIKEVSGLSGDNFNIEEWTHVLEADFDDAQWDDIMLKRFGDAYYTAEQDGESDDENGLGAARSKKMAMPKKPKWDDVIGVSDIVHDFDDEAPDHHLLDSSEDEDAGVEDEVENAGTNTKSAKVERAEAKSSQRRNRRIIEAIAEQQLDPPLTTKKGERQAPFRYREVSPSAFGLTTLDILGADDAQLNEFVGLKKLGAYRDPARKSKDKKKFGKKYRLKTWRRDVFGTEDGPQREQLFAPQGEENKDKIIIQSGNDEAVDIKGKKKGKKRSRPKKANVASMTVPEELHKGS